MAAQTGTSGSKFCGAFSRWTRSLNCFGFLLFHRFPPVSKLASDSLQQVPAFDRLGHPVMPTMAYDIVLYDT